jgi:hypothetical protein
MPYRELAIDRPCSVHPAAPAIAPCARCRRDICLVCLASVRLESYCSTCAATLRSRATLARVGLLGAVAALVLVAGVSLYRYIRTPPRLAQVTALASIEPPRKQTRYAIGPTDDERREIGQLMSVLPSIRTGTRESREAFFRLRRLAKMMSCVERLGPPPGLSSYGDWWVARARPTPYSVLEAWCDRARDDDLVRSDCYRLPYDLGCMM